MGLWDPLLAASSWDSWNRVRPLGIRYKSSNQILGTTRSKLSPKLAEAIHLRSLPDSHATFKINPLSSSHRLQSSALPKE